MLFQRFAASTAVASSAIAIAALIVCFAPGLNFQRIYPLPIFWCFAPVAWGIWSLLIPSAWIPERLPLWGAILGLIAGSIAAFVLNLPSRFLGATVSLPLRGAAVLVMVLFYYLLWMLVRAAWRSLAGRPSSSRG
jgi:drug/metabolite transporter (DMT)-like permease